MAARPQAVGWPVRRRRQRTRPAARPLGGDACGGGRGRRHRAGAVEPGHDRAGPALARRAGGVGTDRTADPAEPPRQRDRGRHPGRPAGGVRRHCLQRPATEPDRFAAAMAAVAAAQLLNGCPAVRPGGTRGRGPVPRRVQRRDGRRSSREEPAGRRAAAAAAVAEPTQPQDRLRRPGDPGLDAGAAPADLVVDPAGARQRDGLRPGRARCCSTRWRCCSR
jgi:hypothetical protein